MSYNIIKDDKTFIEAVAFIQSTYPFYVRNKLEDIFGQEKYSVQMILNSIYYNRFESDLFKIVFFDYIIGNSDRHHSNFGFLVNKDQHYQNSDIELAPLYDNGSSLCAYIDKNVVDNILKDKMKFESIINTKSKSMIGWNDIRPIKHLELISKIKNTYYDKTIDITKIITAKLNTHTIDNILNKFSDDIIDSKIKILLKLFIIERKNRLIEIYDLKGDM